MKTLLTALTLISVSFMANAQQVVRFASFNVSMDATNYRQGDEAIKASALSTALNSNHQQIRNIAEIIQKVRPDVVLLNEFDRAQNHLDALPNFINNYLNKGQNGQKAIDYPYTYWAPVNTGVLMKHDITGDGIVTHPNDTYGFGHYPGQYAMAILSRYPIDKDNIRTFQKFKWKDMPGALKPVDPKTGKSWYSEKVWNDFRLSSKSHWDVPININGKTVHVLASHPTPPVFDGPEDRNGRRNHDEVRFWVDYLNSENNEYIYDDSGKNGGLAADQHFVIMGDLNASNISGDGPKEAINALLTHDRVFDPQPTSAGAEQHKPDDKNAKYHTAYWGMRADYAVPSKTLMPIVASEVYWPTVDQVDYRLIKDRAASSDHRLVWVDVTVK